MRLAIYTGILAIFIATVVILWPVFVAILNLILAILASLFWFILIAIGLWLLYKGITLIVDHKH